MSYPFEFLVLGPASFLMTICFPSRCSVPLFLQRGNSGRCQSGRTCWYAGSLEVTVVVEIFFLRRIAPYCTREPCGSDIPNRLAMLCVSNTTISSGYCCDRHASAGFRRCLLTRALITLTQYGGRNLPRCFKGCVMVSACFCTRQLPEQIVNLCGRQRTLCKIKRNVHCVVCPLWTELFLFIFTSNLQRCVQFRTGQQKLKQQLFPA